MGCVPAKRCVAGENKPPIRRALRGYHVLPMKRETLDHGNHGPIPENMGPLLTDTETQSGAQESIRTLAPTEWLFPIQGSFHLRASQVGAAIEIGLHAEAEAASVAIVDAKGHRPQLGLPGSRR